MLSVIFKDSDIAIKVQFLHLNQLMSIHTFSKRGAVVRIKQEPQQCQFLPCTEADRIWTNVHWGWSLSMFLSILCLSVSLNCRWDHFTLECHSVWTELSYILSLSTIHLLYNSIRFRQTLATVIKLTAKYEVGYGSNFGAAVKTWC